MHKRYTEKFIDWIKNLYYKLTGWGRVKGSVHWTHEILEEREEGVLIRKNKYYKQYNKITGDTRDYLVHSDRIWCSKESDFIKSLLEEDKGEKNNV